MLGYFGLSKTISRVLLPGEKLGTLTIIAIGRDTKTNRIMAICQCDCGNKKVIRADAIKSGVILSCGCFNREKELTHGLSKSPHYARWRHMLDRCENAENAAWKDYGGRGIKVCERWHDIAAFIADLPPGYRRDREIDRIDNDGHYEPGNIRWATRKQNTGNRRSAHDLTFQGKTQSLTKWANEVGIGVQTLWERIEVWQWPIDKALTTPPMSAKERMAKAHETRWAGHVRAESGPKTGRRLRRVEYKGDLVTMAELSAITGISAKLLAKRLFERGWPIDRAICK